MEVKNEKRALDVLRQVFGYQQFKPLQETIIQSVLDGRDNLVLMPTGGGKSLCYQIPALLCDGVGIVISPLISLMQDQVQALLAKGVAAAYYNSTLSAEESRKVLAKLHNYALDLLYIAPERLMSSAFIERLADIPISLFAIDEAHCISQWGPDFRPEYLQLVQLKKCFPEVPLIALTASADKQTREDIGAKLGLNKVDFHLASFNRPNIHYLVNEKYQPFDQLSEVVASRAGQCGIIYCSTRNRVEEIAEKLLNKGISVRPYHAGLSNKERQKTLDLFLGGDIEIVVATIAFGMGIDKPNVRFVIHYDLPKNMESFYQESGRAGRDGLAAESILFYGLGDLAIIKGIIQQSKNEAQRLIEMQKLNRMIDFAEAQTCRRRVLLNYFDELIETDCQNCDICLSPPETYDATIEAQKALSCVYRVGQSFGVTHVVNVLRGLESPRMKNLRHDKLSVFGIGSELSQAEWQNIIRQLIHRGYIEQDISRYSILKLKARAKPLLSGNEKLFLAKPRTIIEKPKKKKRRSKQF